MKVSLVVDMNMTTLEEVQWFMTTQPAKLLRSCILVS